jgi:hypothetical protein
MVMVGNVPLERAKPLWETAMQASRESVEREIKA